MTFPKALDRLLRACGLRRIRFESYTYVPLPGEDTEPREPGIEWLGLCTYADCGQEEWHLVVAVPDRSGGRATALQALRDYQARRVAPVVRLRIERVLMRPDRMSCKILSGEEIE